MKAIIWQKFYENLNMQQKALQAGALNNEQ